MRYTVSNLVDLIAHEPGISQITTGPAIAKPVIRGLGFNRVVVLNDGVRQEGQQWGDEHGLEVDEYSVQKIEIVKGPASLMYGSDAMAGVIQVLTNTPVPQGMLKGNVMGQYQTNNRLRGSSLQLGAYHRNGFNWNGYVSMKAAADYRNRYDGYVYNSKFREANAGGYFGWNGAWGYSHIILSTYGQKTGVVEGERDDLGRFVKPMPGGDVVVAEGNDFTATTPQVPWQFIRHNRVVSDNSFNAGKGRLNLNVAWQQNRRQEFGNADEPKEKSLYFDLQTFTLSSIYHFNHSSPWQSSMGISMMRQENKNKGVELLIPAYRIMDAGGFFYTRRNFRNVTFSGGLRADTRSMTGDAYKEGNELKFADLKRSFSNLSGSVGLSYQPTSSLTYKWNIAKGFRAPTIAELASNGAHEGTNRYEYGVSGLRSENSWQTDAGVDWNAEHLSIRASLFYNSIRRFIFYQKLEAATGGDSLVEVDGEPLMAFTFNQRNAHLYGAELTVDLHPHPLDWLHIENTFNFVRGIFAEPIEGNRNIPFMPAPRLLTQVRAELRSKAKWWRNGYVRLELDQTFTQNRVFTVYDTETKTHGYVLLHAGLGADIVSKGRVFCTLHFSANNITDVAYQQHLSRLKYTAENLQTGRTGVFNMGRNIGFRVSIPLDHKL
jgi:iron complex outermembrane receptor protein